MPGDVVLPDFPHLRVPAHEHEDVSRLVEVAAAATTDDVIRVKLASESQGTYRFVLNADGTMEWGPGNATTDIRLFRGGGDVLESTDRIRSVRANSSDVCFEARISGDTNSRLRVAAAGDLVWGDGSTTDTTLFRRAANVLKTDDQFEVGANLLFSTDGYIHFTTEIAGPTPGANTAILYIEDNGAGKTRLVAGFSSGAVVVATQP